MHVISHNADLWPHHSTCVQPGRVNAISPVLHGEWIVVQLCCSELGWGPEGCPMRGLHVVGALNLAAVPFDGFVPLCVNSAAAAETARVCSFCIVSGDRSARLIRTCASLASALKSSVRRACLGAAAVTC